MGKRALAEAPVAGEEPVPGDPRPSKRIRSVKKLRLTEDKQPERKQLKKLKKTQKSEEQLEALADADSIAASNSTEIKPPKYLNFIKKGLEVSPKALPDNQEESEKPELSKEEREERKRLKKLRRTQKSIKTSPNHDIFAPPAAEVKRDDEKERKAERKAARKAKKRQTEGEALADPVASTEISLTSSVPQSAVSTSVVQSSVTSPEPTPQPSLPAAGYIESSALAALPQAEIENFLSSNYIAIMDPLSSSKTLRPISKFKYIASTENVQIDAFKSFKSPTPIQAASWPYLFSGRDVIGVAETGSGKTLAFAVPCVRYIMSLLKGKKPKGAMAVVVSPTRELALQTYEQILQIASPVGLVTVCVYGGVAKEEQRRLLKTASIVVATPGRLNDLINEGAADLCRVGYLVLDEADRMLDKGFEEEIRKIINTTPPTGKRQTLMFTATWPQSVRELAKTFMTSPVKIAIGDNPSGDLRANTRITQKVEVVDPRGKEMRLLQLLKQYQSGEQRDDRILVFCLYKKEATRVESFIRSKGFRVAGIHGDLSQLQRTTSLDAFKQGKVPILVATDVAARGLDIPAVKMVINVTFPLTVEDYVHRIGRTGRAGKEGLAITLFTEHDKPLSGALINVLKAANQEVPDDLLKFGTTVKKKGHEAYGAFYKETDGAKTATKIVFD
ncbi:MAG: RNA-dependent ATPase [Trizodia sp. TS-e1964]|nr:MAG: RNA-dependent ATPase [Trizodia sp. TS-e1964]